jgi:hypothetical protein
MSYFEPDTKIEDVYPLHIPGVADRKSIGPSLSEINAIQTRAIAEKNAQLSSFQGALERAHFRSEEARKELLETIRRRNKYIKRLKKKIAELSA